ncbi:MAG: hypothetical protein HZY77_06795 [Thiobacillus sp.]|uniref:hypothetical protein n=1 Tax=Thiobacillus sp. TaxID=924 RepID=UPI00168C4CDF|nr:hypothetical protein [Thiobacillus sp.]QLQ02574.1 MAG: hypothetical protein HZY77_06795 [Thiobacillus sp.]
MQQRQQRERQLPERQEQQEQLPSEQQLPEPAQQQRELRQEQRLLLFATSSHGNSQQSSQENGIFHLISLYYEYKNPHQRSVRDLRSSRRAEF